MLDEVVRVLKQYVQVTDLSAPTSSPTPAAASSDSEQTGRGRILSDVATQGELAQVCRPTCTSMC